MSRLTNARSISSAIFPRISFIHPSKRTLISILIFRPWYRERTIRRVISHTLRNTHVYARRERKKRNTLKKKGMTSRARWWHMARAAGSVDGVRIIVTLAAEGGGGGGGEESRELCHHPADDALAREGGCKQGAGAPRCPRASERANRQADRRASERSARVARVSYAGTTHAVVEVGACSRPAAAS